MSVGAGPDLAGNITARPVCVSGCSGSGAATSMSLSGSSPSSCSSGNCNQQPGSCPQSNTYPGNAAYTSGFNGPGPTLGGAGSVGASLQHMASGPPPVS